MFCMFLTIIPIFISIRCYLLFYIYISIIFLILIINLKKLSIGSCEKHGPCPNKKTDRWAVTIVSLSLISLSSNKRHCTHFTSLSLSQTHTHTHIYIYIYIYMMFLDRILSLSVLRRHRQTALIMILFFFFFLV